MNQFEYHTWLSEVTNSEEEDKIYCIQVANKENNLNELRRRNEREKALISAYDIIGIDEFEINKDNTEDNGCVIS